MSTELVEPDVVVSAGVGRDGVLVAARPILRKPLTIGQIDWLPPSAVGEDNLTLSDRRAELRPEVLYQSLDVCY